VNAGHLYVHVPFCARRCVYCDFSIAVRRRLPVGDYLAALSREVARAGVPGDADTVYLGGGTPSRLGAVGVAALVALLGLRRRPAEFTIEANPEDVTPESVRAWTLAGINRLSLGAQSFDDRVLAWMHRTHDATRIGEAVAAARHGGVQNLSLDLIFALPEALGRDFSRDLDVAVALEPDHISLYGLTVEPGTALFRRVGRGELSAAPEQRYEEEYLLAHERLSAAGYVFYEVSNAARPGREAAHNRSYWTLEAYLGLGPSAHSFDGTARWWNEPAYARWRRELEQGRSPVAGRELLNDHQRRLEEMYLGLRMREGIVLPDPSPMALHEAVGRWVAAGWAVTEPEPGPATSASQAPGAAVSVPAAAVSVLAAPTPEAPAGPVSSAQAPRRVRVRLTPRGWLRLDELVATI
jgi:oxygen-independent coproporphyrinogen-3 oxidase